MGQSGRKGLRARGGDDGRADRTDEIVCLAFAERWLGLAERVVVDLIALVLLVRTLMSSFEDGPGTEQAFAAGVLVALALVQSERRKTR